ncbi:caspase-8 isoform X1 [Cyprinodon tularosa]|uniref:caspase-8 isoform X1 n=1 Tax=Cyprinodon tularosa TaxID=77115 RepID=UPI0018E21EBB|nr:caspase-8 isoform X1 [Cyprinodon tularosa]XP_038136141.1 caspase-8 isoform X1 [Cyprinodon tularosa]
MDFQRVLLGVEKDLSQDEVEAIAFLCTDLLRKNPNSVSSVSDLFTMLMDEDRLSAEEPQLLIELLLTIQRPVILRELGISDRMFTASQISPYRKLLYHLSEEITTEELKKMKFLLDKDLPRKKLEKKTTLGVFLEMERRDLINEDNLDYLANIFKSVFPLLNEKIRRFSEDKCRPRSSSLPPEPNQILKQFNRTGSFNMNDPMHPLPSMNSFNTSNEPVASLDTSALPEIKRSESQENIEVLKKYQMTGKKRGICLIVNNNDFSHSTVALKERKGTSADEDALKEVFEWLGFDVEIHQDCNGQKILSVLQELRKKDHSQMDCLVCCVLSHGTEGGVYGVDGKVVKIKDMMSPFYGQMCPSLVEKPKLFFIQACQGTNELRPIQADGPEDETSEVVSDARVANESIPTAADFLLGMATLPDYVSFRDKSNGTWYIQSLCQNLVKLVPKGIDLVSILTEVNNDVSKKTDNTQRKKQMPQPSFSLRKRVVFPIPKRPPPFLN